MGNESEVAQARGAISRAAIGDVAARAGVSIATVSRVLNARPDVAPATRELVLQHVRDLGYSSNRNARALAGKRTGLIGLVIPYAQNDFFSGITEGASEALYERDARLVLCPTQHRKDREISFLDHLLQGTTDGSLVVTPQESPEELRLLKRLGSPFVVVDPCSQLDDDIPVVSATNWSGGRRATEHLIGLGHTHIGVISGPRLWCASVDRLAGYHSALMAAGIPIVPEYLVEANFKIEAGYSAALESLALPNRPTAIFAMNDEMAVGTLRAARERGLHVPSDLSIVGFDDVIISRVCSPALTTVMQPLQEMGRLAVTLLYRQINGQPLEVPRMELSTRLIVRDSTAPPPATSFLTY